MAGLLGTKPSRNFKIYRTEEPAIFRFNGKLFMEQITGEDSIRWVEVSEELATVFLEAKSKEQEATQSDRTFLIMGFANKLGRSPTIEEARQFLDGTHEERQKMWEGKR